MSNPIPGPTDQQPSYAAEAAPEAPLNYQPDGQASYQPEPPRPALPTTLAHTNAFAMVAIILAFIQPIAAIVFGHMGLSQIKRNGDAGRGLALTGLIIGYVMTVGAILAVISYFSLLFFFIAVAGAGFSEFGSFNDYYGFEDSF